MMLSEELCDVFYVTNLTRGTALRSVGVNRVRVDSWKMSRKRRHPIAETLLFIEKGHGYVSVNDDRHLVRAGDRVCIPAGAWYEVSTFQDGLVFISMQYPVIHDESTGRHDMGFFTEE